jgi:hypothetical protein
MRNLRRSRHGDNRYKESSEDKTDPNSPFDVVKQRAKNGVELQNGHSEGKDGDQESKGEAESSSSFNISEDPKTQGESKNQEQRSRAEAKGGRKTKQKKGKGNGKAGKKGKRRNGQKQILKDDSVGLANLIDKKDNISALPEIFEKGEIGEHHLAGGHEIEERGIFTEEEIRNIWQTCRDRVRPTSSLDSVPHWVS